MDLSTCICGHPQHQHLNGANKCEQCLCKGFFALEQSAYRIHAPPQPKWTFSLGKPNESGSNLLFHVVHGPNWFHRLMQRFVLGIWWTPYKP